MPNNTRSSVVKLRRKQAPAQQQAPSPVPPEMLPRIGYQLKDGKGHLDLHHDGDEASAIALFTKGLAMPDRGMVLGYLGMVAGYAINDGKIDEDRVNFIVQFVAAMKPKDPAETMMLTQMAAVQYLTMMFASRLGRASELRSCDFYDRTVNKLARTYAAQMQTLKQYRSDGKQKIVVKHVTVNEGGQAIVGDVTHGGGAGGASEEGEATA
ncbi:hypothetical protein [Taklimakanibacter albus]|uniref:Uncharacterized protein n=1 Tax=Taklimakanibacter albus TaxID=2800327 RepID=A0ACC5R183_9HYPH|nr:hypothetical protein [Aestuariivirga sp. YIM B02566]MBK1866384.1 hypothetical protein [Aestuariivirga sp. YIM B02566]